MLALVLHIVFFAVSLGFIGFEPMMANLYLSIIAYSCYITLKECMICFYLVCLLGSITGGLTWANDQDANAAAGL
jgi:hypothetical protein